MYKKEIKDLNTITWHNLHFILEHYTKETLTILEKIIIQGENEETKAYIDSKTALETKAEVIATVKTLKAMYTVMNHHRTIKTHYREENEDEKTSLAS